MLSMFVGGTSFAGDVNTDVLLHSISSVESGGDISVVGRMGERSQYQFMRSTWAMYSRTPFKSISLLRNQSEVDRVARRHVEFIKMTLIERGMKVSIYNIAMAWNGGPNKTRYTLDNRDYASRVENIYEANIAVVVTKTAPIAPPPVLRFDLDPNRVVFTIPSVIAQVPPPYRIAGF